MNRDSILSTVRARMEAVAQEHLADSIERLLREGYDETTIADYIGTAIAHNQHAIQASMAEVEAMLNREHVQSVRSLTFTDSRDVPAVH